MVIMMHSAMRCREARDSNQRVYRQLIIKENLKDDNKD